MPAGSDPSDGSDPSPAPPRSRVVSWYFWDWGSTGIQAVMVTFVFAVYLTDTVGHDVTGSITATGYLSGAMAVAGFLIAVLAPVLGQQSDAAGRRKFALAVWSGLLFVSVLGCFFVADSVGYLWLGLTLLPASTVFFELANTSYYAMLRQVSTPATIGRVSAIGWGCGYLGGIVTLVIAYFGFVAGDGPTRGVLNVPTDEGLNIRLVAVMVAVWFAIFALPLFFTVPELAPDPTARGRKGVVASYRELFRSVADLWRNDRNAVRFLVASAVFRDGLTTTFSLGAVLAVSVFGLTPSTVLLFGIAANVCAALGAFVAGRFDDSVSPKAVIAVSLLGMIVAGTVLALSSGPTMFWIFGLALTLFVGPAQASARSMMARMATPGREGQMFGLYQTTGRAVAFLGPALFTVFVAVFGSDRAGMVSTTLLIAVGLGLLLAVRSPVDRALAPTAPARPVGA